MNKINKTTEELVNDAKNKIEKAKVALQEVDSINSWEDLERAILLCKIYLSSQSAGAALERLLIRLLSGTPIALRKRKREKKGSADVRFGEFNCEIKVSTEGSNDQFHFVQIRLDSAIDYYLFMSYSISFREIRYFVLSQEEMKRLLVAGYSVGYAHGTVKKWGLITEDNLRDDCEYCFRPNFKKSVDKAWEHLKHYEVSRDFLIEKFNPTP